MISSPSYTSTEVQTVKKTHLHAWLLFKVETTCGQRGSQLTLFHHSVHYHKKNWNNCTGTSESGQTSTYLHTHVFWAVYWKLKMNWYTNMVVWHFNETSTRPPFTQHIIPANTQMFTTMI